MEFRCIYRPKEMQIIPSLQQGLTCMKQQIFFIEHRIEMVVQFLLTSALVFYIQLG
jgi:hypothetical protein